MTLFCDYNLEQFCLYGSAMKKNVEVGEIRGTAYNKYVEQTPLQYSFPFLFA